MIISLIFASLMAYALAVPVKDETIEKDLRGSMGKFSLELTRSLLQSSKPEENVLLSPVNIYAALSMATLGAGSKTREQLAAALGLPAKLDADYNSVFEQLGSMLDSVTNNQKANVSMANAMFIAPKFPIKDGYKSDLQRIFHSDVYTADFPKGGKEAAEIVNKWVSEKTHGRIDKIFDGEAPTETIALLASALYFHAKWKNEFKVYETTTDNFYAAYQGSTPQNVMMMKQTGYFKYANNPDLKYEAIELPYQNDEFNMYVMLPHKDQTLLNLTQHLTVKHLVELSKTEGNTLVTFRIPKFKINRAFSVKESLEKLGATEAFSNSADFAKIADYIKISDVKHKVEIQMDEEGTIGSAATTVSFVPYSSFEHYPPPIVFNVDRPFTFYIQHAKSRFVVFSAVVNNLESINKS